METRDGAAGNSHEEKWEQLPFDDRSAAVNERREVRKLDVGMDHEDADDQDGNRAQLDVGREIVARLQHQPDGKNRSDQAVDGHENGDLMGAKSEGRRRSALRYPVSGDYAADQKHHAKDTGAGDRNLSGMALEHPQPHDDGDGNGHADGENAPGAIGKRIDHHDTEAGERGQKNKEHGDHRHQTGKGTDFGAGNIRQ